MPINSNFNRRSDTCALNEGDLSHQKLFQQILPHQILTGITWHVRHLPAKHRFSYPYRYWGLSLNRLIAGDFPDELSLDDLLAKDLKISRRFNPIIKRFDPTSKRLNPLTRHLSWKLFSTQAKGWHSMHSFDFSDYVELDKLDASHPNNVDYLQKHLLNRNDISSLNNLPTDNVKKAKLWRDNVLAQFERLTGSQPTGDILALVVGRNLGVYFSPVNFYIGFDDNGDASHLLAEVSNTPWDKRHFYGFILDGNTSEFSHNKGFHVSPFNPLDQVYTWKVNVKEALLASELKPQLTSKRMPMLKNIAISIHVSDSRGTVFEAGINMTPKPMTTQHIADSIMSNPVMNYSSMGRIYWHAFLLYVVKKVPYVGYNQSLKDSKQQDNTIVTRNNKKTPQQTEQNKGRHMSSQTRRPTDRQAKYTTEKLTQTFADRVTKNKALAPIKLGVDMASRRLLFKALSYLQQGSITVIETKKPNKSSSQSDKRKHRQKSKTVTFGNPPKHSTPAKGSAMAGNHPLHATVQVHNKDFYRKLLTGGDIALADSYINGDWDVDDLTALIRLGARNRRVSNQLDGALSKLTKTFEFKKHQSRSNTVSNSKSNILAHYDLGNEMYQTFLDDSMMYSSAIYPAPDTSLYDAQQNKLKTLCELLELTEDDHVIEIGTGWGGFAIFAVQNYGCRVTTTTISDAQYDEAKRRVEQAGLSDRITLLKEDYRTLQGQYDKLISIEMVEAVGHDYLPTFFAKCNELLKPNGIMAMQAITFNDQGYEDYLNSVDFIQSHIFPGGCLLSNQEIITQFTQQTDMVIKSLSDYGYDYARTLQDWRQEFMAHLDDIRAMGYDEAFIRLWQFYFCYCEAGFLERATGVVQVKAVKPDNR